MNVLYETACGHIASRNPADIDLSATFQCRQCLRDTRITGVQLMEYRAKCADCSWTGYAGMSGYLAAGKARRHISNTGHRCVSGWAVNPAAKAERERIAKGKLI